LSIPFGAASDWSAIPVVGVQSPLDLVVDPLERAGHLLGRVDALGALLDDRPDGVERTDLCAAGRCRVPGLD